MNHQANAVLAKVRGMYGRMLTPAQYEELLRKQSLPEISAYLREKTSYAKALAGVQDSAVHRGLLEDLLERDQFHQYERVLHYIDPQEGVWRIVTLNLEVELLLSCLRGIISGRQQESLLADLPTALQPWVRFKMVDLVGVQSVEQRAQVLEHTPYGPALRELLERYPPLPDRQVRYTSIEMGLRARYYTTLLEWAARSTRGQAASQLRELIGLRAELLNLTALWRVKTYFPDQKAGWVDQLLPFRCKLTLREWQAMVKAPDRAALEALVRRSWYGRRLPVEAGEPIEVLAGRLRCQVCRRWMRFATDPQVVYTAYMMLRTMETEDIVRIIEGVRYRMPPDRIEKLLVKTKG